MSVSEKRISADENALEIGANRDMKGVAVWETSNEIKPEAIFRTNFQEACIHATLGISADRSHSLVESPQACTLPKASDEVTIERHCIVDSETSIDTDR